MNGSTSTNRKSEGPIMTIRTLLLGTCTLLALAAAVHAETCNCAGNGSEPGTTVAGGVTQTSEVQCSTGAAPAATISVGVPSANGSATAGGGGQTSCVCVTSCTYDMPYDNPPVPTTTCFEAVPYSKSYQFVYLAAGCIKHSGLFQPTTYTCANYAAQPAFVAFLGQMFISQPCGWSN